MSLFACAQSMLGRMLLRCFFWEYEPRTYSIDYRKVMKESEAHLVLRKCSIRRYSIWVSQLPQPGENAILPVVCGCGYQVRPDGVTPCQSRLFFSQRLFFHPPAKNSLAVISFKLGKLHCINKENFLCSLSHPPSALGKTADLVLAGIIGSQGLRRVRCLLGHPITYCRREKKYKKLRAELLSIEMMGAPSLPWCDLVTRTRRANPRGPVDARLMSRCQAWW
jgi:hypothetical protein